MDLTTQHHLTLLRQSLESRLQALRAERHAATQGSLTDAAVALHEVLDQKDLAEERASARVLDDANRRAVEEEALVMDALDRLDKGTYGECEACGEPISWQRLQVQPTAPRCADCQSNWERALGQAHDHPPR